MFKKLLDGVRGGEWADERRLSLLSGDRRWCSDRRTGLERRNVELEIAFDHRGGSDRRSGDDRRSGRDRRRSRGSD